MLKQVQHDILYYFPVTTQSLRGEGRGKGEKIIFKVNPSLIRESLREGWL